MARFLADVGWVGVYEVGEAVRTRLFQVVLLAYAGGIAASIWILTKILHTMESAAAVTLGVPATERPGAMLQSLVAGGDLARLLQPVVGDGNDAAALLSEPILGLWTGVASMALLPPVLLFSASGSVAAEVKSRSVRYLLVRTGRLQIGLGKLLGQLLIAFVAVTLGGVVAWGMGMTLMVGTPPLDLALSLLGRSARAAAWGLPFAGLGLATSMWIPSPNGARAVAGVGLLGMLVLTAWLTALAGPDFVGRLSDLALQFLATTTWSGYWSNEPGVFAFAAARGLVLAIVYSALGQAVFARRDL